jgi:hypothetical protein
MDAPARRVTFSASQFQEGGRQHGGVVLEDLVGQK